MNLAAWQPTTLLDYPGKVAATLFTLGCNFRCPFCHNPDLVDPERVRSCGRLDPEKLLSKLEERRGFLDAVVITGGEPTLQPDLLGFTERLRGMGFAVKVDTNGSRPEIIRSLIEAGAVDHVAVDVKAPPERYAELNGVDDSSSEVSETIDLLRSGRIDYELRTTVAPGLTEGDIAAIVRWIAPAERYVLQAFRVPPEGREGLLDPTWADREGLDVDALRAVWGKIASAFGSGGVRG